jgi:hypothetical protein
MRAAKLHILATVVLSAVTGLLYGKLPFFPIEISRAASSCPESLLVFRTGAVCLIGTLWITDSINAVTLLLWAGFSAIAVFDDNSNLTMHFVGVGIVLLATTYHVYLRYAPPADKKGGSFLSSLPRAMLGFLWNCRFTLALALVILVARLAVKSSVVLFFEVGLPAWAWAPFRPDIVKLGLSLLRQVFDRALEIMYVGEKGCPSHPTIVLGAYRVAAVMQWVMFYVLSTCF